MIHLSSYILLSFIIFLSGCGNSQAFKLTVSESSSDSRIMWEYMPQVKSVAFFGADKAWFVTEKDGDLWCTEDGGKSWNKRSGKLVGGMFRAVSFIDSQRGLAVNYGGQIWRTSDSGQSWTLISHPKGGEDNEPSFLPQEIFFVDESHGWLVDAFAIWRTDDGGNTWNRSLSLSNKVENEIWQPTKISFVNSNAGWMSATGGIVHRTKDGGQTWKSQKLIPGNADARDVFFISERVGWLTGFVSSTDPQSGTRLYRSDDGGESWKQIPIADNKTYIESICFISELKGWAVGRVSEKVGDIRSMSGIVLHTFDGGKTWQKITVGENELFFDRMYFVDSQYGWLFARDNAYRTQDGGKSWNITLKLPPIKVKD
jgi:photosystem II stability/assembly factor-like uncharacterized protein